NAACTTAAVPSAVLSTTFPVNPSQTTASTAPEGIALASTFPTKLMSGVSASRLCVSRTSAFPLMASSPLLSSPIRGSGTPFTWRRYAEARRAYCTRCCGRGSVTAPASSSSTEPPAILGNGIAIAGRSIPGRRPRPKSAPATTAPELPAETNAAARPSLTASRATGIDARLFRRTAATAWSSMVTTSGASMTVSPGNGPPSPRTRRSTSAARPTSATGIPSSRTARTPPSTGCSGARSPPDASNAIGRASRDVAVPSKAFPALSSRSGSDVKVLHFARVHLDEAAARWHSAPHQHVEGLISPHRVFQRHLEQGAVLGIHRRLPELLWVHLAQTLVPDDLPRLVRAACGDDLVALRIRVDVVDLLARLQAVERRLGD